MTRACPTGPGARGRAAWALGLGWGRVYPMSLCRFVLGLGLALAAASGCVRMKEEGDFEELGLGQASSEPPPGLVRPVLADDLVAVHDRGRLLHQLEKSLRMAYTEGVHTVGSIGDHVVVMPLVDVDPGGRSAQALFVRWRPDSQGNLPNLDAAHAERWLLVSMLLTPDRVLDVEILSGGLAKGSHLATRVDTLVAAAERARALAPGGVFHLLDLYEEVPVDPQKPAKGNTVVAHVYALSADGDGADLEVVLDPPRRRHPVAVKEAWIVHEPGAALVDPLRIQTPGPGPITVARAMLRGLEAGTIEVESSQGRWTVVAGTGLVRPAEPSP